MSSFYANLGLSEKFGTNNSDNLYSVGNQIVWGLGGNDTLTTNSSYQFPYEQTFWIGTHFNTHWMLLFIIIYLLICNSTIDDRRHSVHVYIYVFICQQKIYIYVFICQ